MKIFELEMTGKKWECVFEVKSWRLQVVSSWIRMSFQRMKNMKHFLVAHEWIQDIISAEDPVIWWSAGRTMRILVKTSDIQVWETIRPGSMERNLFQITWGLWRVIYGRFWLGKWLKDSKFSFWRFVNELDQNEHTQWRKHSMLKTPTLLNIKVLLVYALHIYTWRGI